MSEIIKEYYNKTAANWSLLAQIFDNIEIVILIYSIMTPWLKGLNSLLFAKKHADHSFPHLWSTLLKMKPCTHSKGGSGRMFKSGWGEVCLERPSKGVQYTSIVQEEHWEKVVTWHVPGSGIPVVDACKKQCNIEYFNYNNATQTDITLSLLVNATMLTNGMNLTQR